MRQLKTLTIGFSSLDSELLCCEPSRMLKSPALFAPLTLLAILSTLVACGPQEDWVPHTTQDYGNVCINTDTWVGGAQPDITLEADQVVTFSVLALACYQSSCTRNQSISCSVTQEGRLLTLRSSATWESNEAAGAACTTDCGYLIGSCDTQPLAAGSYLVQHGELEMTLEVPGTVNSCPSALHGIH